MEKISIAPISSKEDNANYNKLFLQKEGSDFVSLRLVSKGFSFTNGFTNEVNKSALTRLPKSAMAAFLNYAGVGSINSEKNELSKEMATSLKGMLQVQESLTPFYEGQEAKINPSTGAQVLIDGNPVYRNTIMVAGDAPSIVFGDVIDGKFVAAGVVEESHPTPEPTPTPAITE